MRDAFMKLHTPAAGAAAAAAGVRLWLAGHCCPFAALLQAFHTGAPVPRSSFLSPKV